MLAAGALCAFALAAGALPAAAQDRTGIGITPGITPGDDRTSCAAPRIFILPPDARVSVAEGGAATYAVGLYTSPAGPPVRVSPASGDTGAATVDAEVAAGDEDGDDEDGDDKDRDRVSVKANKLLSLSSGGLLFTMSNWRTPQTVTVTGVQDDDRDDETVTITHRVRATVLCNGDETDLEVAGPTVTVTVRDDDHPVVSLKLTPARIDESGSGNAATVTATLNTAVQTETWITVSAQPVAPAAASDVVLSANKVLKIAPGSLASTGTVTITAADNGMDAADKKVTVSGVASSFASG